MVFSYLDVVSTDSSFPSVTGAVSAILRVNSGTFFITTGNCISKLTSGGVISILAGDCSVVSTTSADGVGTSSLFNEPRGLALESMNQNLYVSERHAIRKINLGTLTVTTVAGTQIAGSADGFGSNASFYYPSGIAVDKNQNILVADTGSHKIRKIDMYGNVTTLITGVFLFPYALTLDNYGNMLISDQSALRRIYSSGSIAMVASVSNIYAIAVDDQNNILAAHLYDILKISSDGTILQY